MNINRAGKQQQAQWKSLEKWEREWTTWNHGDWVTVKKMGQGHAAGWIDGVAWAKKNMKVK